MRALPVFICLAAVLSLTAPATAADFPTLSGHVIDGAEVNEGFARAASNIDTLDVLPSMGANVYDILKRDTLVITKAGVEALEARLK